MKPGILEMTNDEYHYGILKDVLGSSGVRTLYNYTPSHYQAKINQEQKPPTPALIFGIGYHIYMLERPRFNKRVAVAPKCDRRTKAGKALYAKFEKIAKGKLIITEDQMVQIQEMAAAMNHYKTASSILKNKGHFERTILWKDPRHGFMCKARPDLEIPKLRLLVDVKTTGGNLSDASPERFKKAVANYGYDIQAAWYVAGMQAATGQPYQWIWLAQEKDPPYGVGLYEATQEILDNGRKKIRMALEIYNECLKTKQWPGYLDKVMPLDDLPAWAKV